MKTKFRFGTKLGARCFNKFLSSMQSSNFVFIFVSQQFEVASGNCVCECALATDGRLARVDFLNESFVS